jgi:cytochrome P450
MSNHLSKIQLKTSHLVTRFAKLKKGVDVVNEFELFAFKLMAFIIFSEDIDETARLASEAEDVYATLRLSQRAIGTYGHVPWCYSIATKFKWLVPDNDNFTKLAQQMVDRRRNKKPDVPDLFTYLLPTIGDPNSAGLPISWEARLAMVAGSGNVSSALLSTSFYLATNPRIMEQLQEEVDPLISSGEFDPKKGYPILDSILFETFRMQPLVPNGGERVSPPEGLMIGEHFIPGNTVIKVPLYTIFRDSRYFERPKEWIPSRWTTDKSLVKDGSAFIPFSTGVYSCVGRPLGIVEIRDVVAQLVHVFNFKIADDRSPKGFENSGQDHFGMVFEPGSLLLDFEHRKK